MYSLIIALIAVCYLIIAYLPFSKLAFLQNYQFMININDAFDKLAFYTLVATVIGALYLFLIHKVLAPYLEKEAQKHAAAAKTKTVATYLVIVGLAASLLTLMVSVFYTGGLYGLVAKPQPWTAEELERISVHEAGHAVMREIEYPGSTIRAEIVSPSDIADANNWFEQSLPSGFVMGENPSRLPSKEQIMKNIRIYLAGLAAEKIIYGDKQAYISASDDLDKVHELVVKLCNNGLTSCGPQSWAALNDEEKSALYKEIVEPQYQRVQQILAEHQKEIKGVAKALQEKKTLTGDEIRRLINHN